MVLPFIGGSCLSAMDSDNSPVTFLFSVSMFRLCGYSFSWVWLALARLWIRHVFQDTFLLRLHRPKCISFAFKQTSSKKT